MGPSGTRTLTRVKNLVCDPGTLTDDLEFLEGGSEFYKFGEIGWSPSMDQYYSKKLNLLVWRVGDSSPVSGIMSDNKKL